jgi:TolA-binding protein
MAIYSFYLNFQIAFSGKIELQTKVEQLERQLLHERTQKELARYEMESFKQYVAMNLPERVEGQSYGVRNIASLISPSDKQLLDKIKIEFQRFKELYLNQKFDAVNAELPLFIEKYNDSPYVLEAQFLLANSYYKTQMYEKSLSAIHFLVNQYPESEITGLGLLLMGEILEKQERWDEAKEVYQSVEKNFKFPELKKKAQERMSQLKV